MTRKLRILLVQGHRNTSGGNPAEVAITPLAARAIQRALRAAGHTADMLQNEANWFAGSLDAVGREVVRRHNANAYDIMLDIHFESDANNTRGVLPLFPMAMAYARSLPIVVRIPWHPTRWMYATPRQLPMK